MTYLLVDFGSDIKVLRVVSETPGQWETGQGAFCKATLLGEACPAWVVLGAADQAGPCVFRKLHHVQG